MITRPTDDAAYFHVRAIEEQLAAQRATCAAARERHDEMAAVYRFREMLARSSSSGTPTFTRIESEPAPAPAVKAA